MIDYIKVFKDTINKNFEPLAKEMREKHPRVKSNSKDKHATFGLSIEYKYKDFLPYIEGQAYAYTQEMADLLQNYKIKSIDIKLKRTSDKDMYILLTGRLELEDR